MNTGCGYCRYGSNIPAGPVMCHSNQHAAGTLSFHNLTGSKIVDAGSASQWQDGRLLQAIRRGAETAGGREGAPA